MKMNLCECGCGVETRRGNRFRVGHNTRAIPRSSDVRERIAKAMRVVSNTPKTKAKTGYLARCRWTGPEYETKVSKLISIATKGHISWHRGLNSEMDDRVMRNAESRKGLKRIPFSSEHRKRMADSRRGKKRSLETKIRISKTLKKYCKSPEHLEKILEARHIKPNKQELLLGSWLRESFPNEWLFVGNGQLIINGKCPDFTNVNGKKALIELYGDYWHRGEKPEDRISMFRKFGFDTLVIWESELKNKDLVLGTIKTFINRIGQREGGQTAKSL